MTTPVVVFTIYGIQRLRLSLQATEIPTTIRLLNTLLLVESPPENQDHLFHTDIYIYSYLSLSMLSFLCYTEILSIP